MIQWQFVKKSAFAVLVYLLVFLISHSQAQDGNSQATEVYLSFQYRGVVSAYTTSYYKDQQFYLPVSELFNQLKIQHQVDQGSLIISGNYLGEKPFHLNFANQTARVGDTEINLRPEDFIIKEIDYFIKPEVFQELFGLTFTTDFNNLTLDLETKDKMPVFAQYEREQQRENINRDQPRYERNYYPLKYNRNYGIVDGAFLDYNISGIYTNNSQLFTFSNAIGAEFMGGDVQGNLYGSLSNEQSSFTTSGLRWRYVQRDNKYFSSGIAGQTNTEGISNRSITGFKVSNKPVEPRLLFDRYVIDGSATPQSEVELYLNNRLVDYQEADQSGNYRFVVPLTYGNTDYSVQIYRPSGRTSERNARIHIPFDYIPPGEVDYSFSGGRLQNSLLGSRKRGYVGAASVSTGVAKWLTAKASSEYLTGYHRSLPSFTGTLNARLASSYLVSASFNSENFYRLTSSVVYGSGASWNVSYDYNPGNSRLYNIGGNDHQARVNLFTPFQVGSVPLNMRWSSTYQQSGNAKQLRYRADLNTRLGRLNVRLGYQDQQSGALSLISTPASRITNSYTYSVGRSNNIPDVIRGMFIRGQWSYLPGLERLEEVEFQLSRDLFQTGRMQLTFGRNFLGNFNSLSLNFTVDFNNIRSNTTSRSTGSDMSITQNIRGSVGYNHSTNQLLFNNRQQVGQSGAAVRLFVDNNNDGTYQDSTDDVINDPAVQLNRSGGQTSVKDGINYISQLLPYYRYDLEINKGVLSNPLLVPDVENFSIVTDPNQYKTIEIPFYLSGVISGKVKQQQDSTSKALSGVRMYLESTFGDSTRQAFSKEIRTFSDGSFYAYEIPPGKYDLFIDPNQLEFLTSVSEPDTMEIEIESLAQGDFVEGLNFTVLPKPDTSPAPTPVTVTSDSSKKDTDGNKKDVTDREYIYKIQLISSRNREKAKRIAKQATQNLDETYSVVQYTSNNWYAVRSLAAYTRSEALEKVNAHQKDTYENVILVGLKKDKQERLAASDSKYIQIGAFSTLKKAEQFVQKSEKHIKDETEIFFHAKDKLYKVIIDESFSTEAEFQTRLAKLRKEDTFYDAFTRTVGQNIIRIEHFATFIFQIQGVTSKSEKALPSSILDDNSDIEIKRLEDETIVFDNISTWSQAKDLHQKLSQVSAVRQPVIILIEEK